MRVSSRVSKIRFRRILEARASGRHNARHRSQIFPLSSSTFLTHRRSNAWNPGSSGTNPRIENSLVNTYAKDILETFSSRRVIQYGGSKRFQFLHLSASGNCILVESLKKCHATSSDNNIMDAICEITHVAALSLYRKSLLRRRHSGVLELTLILY